MRLFRPGSTRNGWQTWQSINRTPANSWDARSRPSRFSMSAPWRPARSDTIAGGIRTGAGHRLRAQSGGICPPAGPQRSLSVPAPLPRRRSARHVPSDPLSGLLIAADARSQGHRHVHDHRLRRSRRQFSCRENRNGRNRPPGRHQARAHGRFPQGRRTGLRTGDHASRHDDARKHAGDRMRGGVRPAVPGSAAVRRRPMLPARPGLHAAQADRRRRPAVPAVQPTQSVSCR